MSAPVVYRLYDEDGALLYIGHAVNFDSRLYAHMHVTPGTTGAIAGAAELQARYASHTLTEYPTKAEAYDAERDAIRDEAPLLNRMYNPQRWQWGQGQGCWVPVEEMAVSA